MNLLTSFQGNWQKKKFVRAGERTLLAVSGGIDSMVLCDLLLQSGYPFAIAHCNFQLRGKDADLDEQLVSDWAKANNILAFVTRFDTSEASEALKKGIQETARILRYNWFRSLQQQEHFAAIATAHHADDSAETLLINLFKGTGFKGIQGIPERNGDIIRPLLFARKETIRMYAAQNGVPFREDASNASNKYLRNAVRNKLIPAINEYFPAVTDRLNESMVHFRQAALIYNKAIQKELRKLLERRGEDFYIPVQKLLHSDTLETICYELFTPFGMTSAQLPQVLDLLYADSGKHIRTTTHQFIRNRDFIIITAIEEERTDFILIEELPAIVRTDGHLFHFEPGGNTTLIPDADVASVDLDKIKFPLILRRWKQGDYFYPLGMGMKKKKLSRFFIDQKVPVHEKEKVWVLESSRRIVWVAGMRLDERFKIRPSTKQVLKVKMSGYIIMRDGKDCYSGC